MPRTVDKKQKAQAIGDAALQVFRKLGYHRTRMADIAIAAGVGKGTLYEYFKDKLEILRFVLERYFAAFEEGALRAVNEASGPAQRLLALTDFAFAHVADWEDHCAVFVDYFSVARTGEERLLSLTAIYDGMRDMLRLLLQECRAGGEIREEVDPDAAAELLLSIFDGVVLHGVFTDRRCDAHALRAIVPRLLTEGLIVRARREPAPGRSGKAGSKCSATSS